MRRPSPRIWMVLVLLLVGILILSGIEDQKATTPVAGTPPARAEAQEEFVSEATQARWLAWMSDERVPVFWFWRDPSSGKWVVTCHIVARVWSPGFKAWAESAWSLEAALVKVLNAMDADGNL